MTENDVLVLKEVQEKINKEGEQQSQYTEMIHNTMMENHKDSGDAQIDLAAAIESLAERVTKLEGVKSNG